MRVCRYQDDSGVQVGFYADDTVVSLAAAAERYQQSSGETLSFSNTQDLLALLPAGGADHQAAQQLSSWLTDQGDAEAADIRQATDSVQLLVPLPRPNKLFLFAGNYAKNIEDGGTLVMSTEGPLATYSFMPAGFRGGPTPNKINPFKESIGNPGGEIPEKCS